MERIVYCNICLDNISDKKIKDKNICITCNYTTYCDKERCIQSELIKRNRYYFLFDSDCFDTRTCYNCITKHQENKFKNYAIQRFKNRFKINIK